MGNYALFEIKAESLKPYVITRKSDITEKSIL
jgi:hypothetical protein